MLNKLWGWIAAAGLAMLATLQYMAGQRDKARANEQRATEKREETKAAADKSTAVREAQQEVRKDAEQARKEREERPSNNRPLGRFGRLHDD